MSDLHHALTRPAGISTLGGVRARAPGPASRVTAVIAAALLAACASGPPAVTPLPTSAAVPDVRGTWTGSWGGAPVTLLIAEQRAGADLDPGVWVGPIQVLGRRAPGVSGVLTSASPRGGVSATANGWFGSSGGRAALVVVAATVDGRQVLRLSLLDAERLAGTGESDYPWGPQGAVTLTRSVGR